MATVPEQPAVTAKSSNQQNRNNNNKNLHTEVITIAYGGVVMVLTTVVVPQLPFSNCYSKR